MNRLDAVRAALTCDDELDAFAQSRMWARIQERVREREPRRLGWPVIVGMIATATAAVVVVTLWPDRHAETTTAAQLGPHARAALVGEASLELDGTPGEITSAHLVRGTVLAEFEGGAGRSLKIRTHDAVVEVVGTLFSVEVRSTGTCTAVAHGKVRVTTSTGVFVVNTAEQLCTDEPLRPRPISEPARTALERHALVRPTTAPEQPANVHPDVRPIEPLRPPLPAASPARVPPRAPPPARHRVEQVQPAPPTPVASQRQVPAPSPQSASSPPTETSTPAVPVTLSAEDLYRAAESALSARDAARADQSLKRLIADYPGSALVDQALYERARIAYQRRAWNDARRHLDRLAAFAHSPLTEPGRYLACRVAVETGDAGARQCLIEYRNSYPRFPHDVDVLGLLVQLSHASGGCANAAAFLDELARSYPRSKLAIAWRARCPEAP